MKTTELKEKLHRYIDTAKTEKLKAIYTMLEDDIELRVLMEEEAFYDELEKRVEELDSGKEKGIPWEEVQEKALKLAKKSKAK